MFLSDPFARDFLYPLWYNEMASELEIKSNVSTPLGTYTYELSISLFGLWFEHDAKLLVQEYVFELVEEVDGTEDEDEDGTEDANDELEWEEWDEYDQEQED